MQERNSKIDFLRCIACISVVIIHTVAVFWYDTPVPLLSLNDYFDNFKITFSQNLVSYQTKEWFYCSVVDALARFSVPVFVMISGGLMLNKCHLEYNYIKKKVIHLIRLILTWGGVQGIIYLVKCTVTDEKVAVVKLLRMIIKGPGAFWFLYMIIPLYFMAPILKEILKSKEISKYFLVMWIVFGLLASTFKIFFSSFQELPQLEYLNCVPVYIGYFFLGGYLEKYGVSKRIRNFICVGGIIGVLIMTFGVPTGLFHNFTTPLCALYSTAVFVCVDTNRGSNSIKQMAQKFASHTTGIYAMHGFSLSIMRRLWKPCIQYIFFQVPIYVAFSVCICTLVTFILKRNRFLNGIV